jgi:hypothetical protein
LTCDIQFRTEGDITVALPFDNASKLLELFHTVSLRYGAYQRPERNQLHL